MPPFPPIEPQPTRVRFPDPRRAAGDIVAVGADFRAGTVLAAYRRGIFPWPVDAEVVPWASPVERAIFPLAGAPAWSRSLRRTLRKCPWEVTLDEAFGEVVHACGATRPQGTWILPEIERVYGELHALGWAHSVEVWEREGEARALVGGIYGLAVGGLFAGESMFHARTDASKVAFARLVERLRDGGFVLFDVQVLTAHLASLGCTAITRDAYLARLPAALGTAARLS